MTPFSKNLAATVTADAGSRILGFVITAYLARTLGPSSFGIITVALSVLGYAATAAGPGMNVYGARWVAAAGGPEKRFAESLIRFRALLSIGCIVIAAAISLAVYGATRTWATTAVFCLAALPMVAAPDWYLQGKKSMGWIAAGRLGLYLAYLALVLLLVRTPADVVWTGVSFVLASFLMAGISFVGYRNVSGGAAPEEQPAPRWRMLFRESVPLGLSSVLAQTVFNLPVLIVGALCAENAVGYFGAAMKLVFFVLIVDRVSTLLLLPIATRAYVSGGDDFQRIATMGIKWMLLVMGPVTVLGMRYALWAICIVYQSTYAPAANVLFWAMPYALFTVVSTVLMTVLFASSKEKMYLRVLGIGTLLIVVCCTVLTVLLGEAGSAAGMSAGELVMMILLFVQVRRIVAIDILPIVGPFLAGIGAMLALLLVFPSLPPIAGALLAVALFLTTVRLLGGVTDDDLRLLREKLS